MESQITDLKGTDIGLHLISPYVGKIRPVLARHLIKTYTKPKSIVYDPFCGSGTVPLEAWACGNKCFATDLNDYAITLTKGKLTPYKSLDDALERLDRTNSCLKKDKSRKESIGVPQWVSSFFHPKTLSEVLKWTSYLKERKEWFLLSCLLGILHHQRPGFLSFPSSHGAPYLRNNKYPEGMFPELYEYREVYSRLRAKVTRAYKNFPNLDFRIQRVVRRASSANVTPPENRIHTIVTSPPYMKSLTYARDNRLRLWFLGKPDWQSLEKRVSPSRTFFPKLIAESFNRWSGYQKNGDHCIIIIGDIIFNESMRLPAFVTSQAEQAGYSLVNLLQDPIPDKKRFNKLKSQISSECILVFERGK
jgi:DNA modification methylase